MLRLSIFGQFRAADATGNEISINSKKARALLAYLALPPGKERSREEVMALLWSERGDEQARSSLRQALSGLRKELGENAVGALKVTDEWLALDPHLVAVEPGSPGDVLLSGLHISDPAFDEWLRDERQRHDGKAVADTHSPELSHPDKPSIAVLPFINLSADPEQEYFSDGITEDIIAELSRSQSLFVIARNSSFLFKGQSVDVVEVGNRLGVCYVVEGSVRKAGNRIRIAAQLVEAETRNHVWADRYDRDLEDLFAVQDEVTERIAWALVGKVGAAEISRTKRTRKRLDAYEQLLRGIEAIRRFTPEDAAIAVEFLKSAISLEPDTPTAHAWLAAAYADVAGFGGDDSMTDLALQAAQKAIELGDNSGQAEAIMATICGWRRQFDAAEGHLQRALTLGPTHVNVLAWTGYVCMWNGQLARAREIGERLRRLDPLDLRYNDQLLAFTYYLFGDYQASLDAFHRWNNKTHLRGFANLAACLGQLGRIGEAKATWARCLDIRPSYSIEDYERNSPYRRQEDLDHWLDGLRKAGVGQ